MSDGTRVMRDELCPHCDKAGPIVGVESVHPHRADAAIGEWRYCSTSDCPVIFYLAGDVVDEDEVVAQVGDKATSKTTPVCFCFAHTAFSLAEDLAMHQGVSTARSAVKSAVADGLCSCEHLNPSGKCCLPDIAAALKAIKAAVIISTPPVSRWIQQGHVEA